MRGSIVFALMFLIGCPMTYAHAQSAGYYPKGGPDIPANDVSMIQLIANPQFYDKKTVRITGFLHLEFEGDVIYLHSEDFQYALTKNGLWIDRPENMTEAQMKAVNDHYVICTAIFAAGDHGHMGLSSGALKHVSRLQVWSSLRRPLAK